MRWRFGRAELDGVRLRLRVDDRDVEVEPKPLHLLTLLLERPGEVLTKRELMEALWPGREVTDGVLTNAVNKLRAALNDSPPTVVRTVHGFGYSLAVPVASEPITDAAPHPGLQLMPGLAPPLRPHWQLLQRLGRGGQGEVWLAVHTKTREQRVFKFALDEAALAALKREVTLYRLLSQQVALNASLVRILDWNFSDRPCFLECEHQPLGNLEDWAKARGGLGTLPLAARLQLFAQLCEDVGQAHDLGVLHKDLKPANLFPVEIDGATRLRLGDWGIGQLTSDAALTAAGITRLGFTQSESSEGTPLYRAPELLSGGTATRRGDLYALGVILYQLVVADLRRPLAPGWEQDVEDIVLREDIALAAHGRPSSRLGDATELARRIRSLEARRQERLALQQQTEQLTRAAEVQRLTLARAEGRRTLLQASLFAALGALLVIGGLLLRAEALRRESERQRENAQAVTRFLTEDLLAAANPFTQGRRDLTVRETLDAASRQLDVRLPDPGVRATTHLAIGSAYAGIGEREKAEQHLQTALKHWQASGEGDGRAAQAARTALAEMYAALRNFPAMVQTAEAILASEQRTATTDPALGLRAQLALDFAHCHSSGLGQASCLDRLRTTHQTALDVLGQAHADTARIGLSLATVLSRSDPTGAVALGQQSIAAWRAAKGPDDPLLLARSQDFGIVLTRAGKPAEALAHFTDLRERITRIYGEMHPEVQLVEINMVEPMVATGSAGEALVLARRLKAQTIAARGERDLYSRFLMGEEARALTALGRKDEALPLLRTLVALDEATDGPSAGQTPRHRQQLADLESAP